MFTWLKRRSAKRAIEKQFRFSFDAAVGSVIQRWCIAAAMSAIEGDYVRRQCAKLSPASQSIFMMAFSCFVMWFLKLGMEEMLNPADVESAIAAMELHFSTLSWHNSDAYMKIWDKMQITMPMALKPTADGVVYPVTEMLLAPNLAGYPLNPMIGSDLEFGIRIRLEIGVLTEAGRIGAREHLRINRP